MLRKIVQMALLYELYLKTPSFIDESGGSFL
jgi:hypothetical protein